MTLVDLIAHFFPTESQHISACWRGGVPGVGCNTSERRHYSISVTCWQKPEIALNRKAKELLAVPSQPCWMGPLWGKNDMDEGGREHETRPLRVNLTFI